jgi:FkbM family methyltransferase
MNLEKFIWEPKCYDGFKETVEKEIFVDKIYERMFEVEEGDIVFDIGASLGPFTYSILEKKPSQVFAFEPSYEEFKTLVLNTRHGNVTHINKGISDTVGEFNFNNVFDNSNNYKLYSTTFKKVINDYNITKIDFLKTDCEAGEYDIFTLENLFWIKGNVRKICGEWHLGEDWMKEKFRIFRDVYLRVFPNFKIFSFDGIDITWQIWNPEFIPFYREIMVYIDNRSDSE